MRLAQLREVIAVADCGSLRGAARHLGVPQPAISRSIRSLETEIGAPLFERGVGGALLTAAGQAFVARARYIEADIEQLEDELRQIQSSGRASVTVGMGQSAQIELLPRIIGPFATRYPTIDLNIREGMFQSMEMSLHEGKLDFYVGGLPPRRGATSGLGIEVLFDFQLVVAARRGHPRAGATSLTELADAEWVTTSPVLAGREPIGPLFRELGLAPPRLVARAETALSVIALISSSDLLTLVPQPWLQLEAASSLICRLKVSETLPGLTSCIARVTRQPLTPQAEFLYHLICRAAANRTRHLL